MTGNLSMRIMTILLGGFALLELLLWTLLTISPDGEGRYRYNLPAPADVQAMAETLETAPPGRRQALLVLFNDSLYSVHITAVVPGNGDVREAGLRRRLAEYTQSLPGRKVSISRTSGLLSRLAGSSSGPRRYFAPVTLAVGLRDGETMTIDGRPSAVIRLYLRQRAFVAAIGGLLLLSILFVAVRQTVRPLRRLSGTIRAFSEELAAPDLPVSGSAELRDLALAFNQMKHRIVDLVEERTRILAAVAHDMRTYLTRLRLRVHYLENATQRAKAISDLDEMSALVDDTLLFAASAAQGTEMARVDLAEEIVAVVTRSSAPERIDFVSPDDPVFVVGTSLLTRRMLMNVLDNALRHGERVSITLEVCGPSAEIVVSDDGPGVPEDQLSRLGRPFDRLDPSRDRTTGGTGLGLAIVVGLAQRQSADVTFSLGSQSGLKVVLSFKRTDTTHVISNA